MSDLAEKYDTAARKVHCALTRHRWGITKRIKLGNEVISPGVQCFRCGKDKALKPLPAGHPDNTGPTITSDQAAWLDDVDDVEFPAEVG